MLSTTIILSSAATVLATDESERSDCSHLIALSVRSSSSVRTHANRRTAARDSRPLAGACLEHAMGEEAGDLPSR